jgi:hypothetical protein
LLEVVLHSPLPYFNHMLFPSRPPLWTGRLSDLYVYDPATMVWTDISDAADGTVPAARSQHCFTAAGGRLYVHGGNGGNGEVCFV